MNIKKLTYSSKVTNAARRIKVSLSGDTVQYSATFPEQEESVFSFNVSEILLRADAADHTVFVLTNKGNVINLYAETLPSRKTPANFFSSAEESAVVAILVPSLSNSQSVSAVVVAAPDDELEISGDFAIDGTISTYLDLMPKLNVGAPQVNGSEISFGITCNTEQSVKVFVESTAGVVLTPQLQLVNGVGTAIVSVAGLPVNTVGKLKAGFKFYTSVAQADFAV